MSDQDTRIALRHLWQAIDRIRLESVRDPGGFKRDMDEARAAITRLLNAAHACPAEIPTGDSN